MTNTIIDVNTNTFSSVTDLNEVHIAGKIQHVYRNELGTATHLTVLCGLDAIPEVVVFGNISVAKGDYVSVIGNIQSSVSGINKFTYPIFAGPDDVVITDSNEIFVNDFFICGKLKYVDRIGQTNNYRMLIHAEANGHKSYIQTVIFSPINLEDYCRTGKRISAQGHIVTRKGGLINGHVVSRQKYIVDSFELDD